LEFSRNNTRLKKFPGKFSYSHSRLYLFVWFTIQDLLQDFIKTFFKTFIMSSDKQLTFFTTELKTFKSMNTALQETIGEQREANQVLTDRTIYALKSQNEQSTAYVQAQAATIKDLQVRNIRLEEAASTTFDDRQVQHKKQEAEKASAVFYLEVRIKKLEEEKLELEKKVKGYSDFYQNKEKVVEYVQTKMFQGLPAFGKLITFMSNQASAEEFRKLQSTRPQDPAAVVQDLYAKGKARACINNRAWYSNETTDFEEKLKKEAKAKKEVAKAEATKIREAKAADEEDMLNTEEDSVSEEEAPQQLMQLANSQPENTNKRKASVIYPNHQMHWMKKTAFRG
jgi:hypothetical protein